MKGRLRLGPPKGEVCNGLGNTDLADQFPVVSTQWIPSAARDQRFPLTSVRMPSGMPLSMWQKTRPFASRNCSRVRITSGSSDRFSVSTSGRFRFESRTPCAPHGRGRIACGAARIRYKQIGWRVDPASVAWRLA